MLSYIKNFINKRTKLSLAIDAFILILIILMLIPATRKNTIAFILKPTMFVHQPKVLKTKIEIGTSTMEWKLRDLSGVEWTLSDFKGKVIFINLWATWCAPCIAEMPDLAKLHAKYGNEVEFLFVSNETEADITKFLSKKKLNIPVYLPVTNYPSDFETQALPTSFIIDKKGRIVVYKQGVAQWNSRRVHSILNTLIEIED